MADIVTNSISLLAAKQQKPSKERNEEDTIPEIIGTKQVQNQFTTHVFLTHIVQSPPLQYPSSFHRYSDGAMLIVDPGNSRVIIE